MTWYLVQLLQEGYWGPIVLMCLHRVYVIGREICTVA